MSKWYLATMNTSPVMWYMYDFDYDKQESPKFWLSETLDTRETVAHATKASAKAAAARLGLKSWRYVSFP